MVKSGRTACLIGALDDPAEERLLAQRGGHGQGKEVQHHLESRFRQHVVRYRHAGHACQLSHDAVDDCAEKEGRNSQQQAQDCGPKTDPVEAQPIL